MSIFLLLLPFINVFHDNAFSSETKTLKYIFEPFLKLNGTDFYDIENHDQLQLEEFTLATWFRSNQSSFDEPAHIVNKGGFNNERLGKNMNYGVWMNTDGTITAGFESQRGKNFEILSQKKYNDGNWHYAVVLYNSTVLKVDIDGHTIGNLEVNETPDTTGNQPLRIGANSLDLDKYFKGEVDELRIWNRGLTINELNEIYTNRSFTSNGQIEYLNFGKNIMEDNKETIDNKGSKTNVTKQELPTTIEPTKQPRTIVFIFVLSKDILHELEAAASKKEHQPGIVENQTPSTLNTNNSITNAIKQELPTIIKKPIVENQTSGKIKTNVTKEGIPTTAKIPTTTKIPTIPTKPNVTKQELPTTTIKKPIVENQTSGKIKTNVTKEGIPTTAKIPTTPTKPNVTKEGITTTPTKIPVTPTKPNVTKEGIPTTPTKTNATKEGIPTTPTKPNVTKQELPTTPT
ncbi:MAG TPA: LamG-like jellyroll fold domain-containing protein, partial [Nitrososphaeraceae archaeon]|nr:LamG-like jellyroll fold domain-containing protein [Nitrososphaeraceae archaeon]